ncbi:MAG: creatininase family protein [Verrucomicrobiia bacterium]
MSPSAPEVRFELMRPHQVRECRERADVAFLPLGVLEWHGVQAPLGTDSIIAHHLCVLAARKLGGGAVFPAVTWGVPRDSFTIGWTSHQPAPHLEVSARELGTTTATTRGFGPHGGMDLQEQWLFYQRLLRMSLETIAGFGFRSIYVLAGHGPFVHFARPACVTFSRATLMAGRPVTTDWSLQGEAAGLDGDHGGKWETSLDMAAEPSSVDLGELQRVPDALGVGSGRNAVESTLDQGRAWAEACAEAISKEARWLVDHHPNLPPRHAHRR